MSNALNGKSNNLEEFEQIDNKDYTQYDDNTVEQLIEIDDLISKFKLNYSNQYKKYWSASKLFY